MSNTAQNNKEVDIKKMSTEDLEQLGYREYRKLDQFLGLVNLAKTNIGHINNELTTRGIPVDKGKPLLQTSNGELNSSLSPGIKKSRIKRNKVVD